MLETWNRWPSPEGLREQKNRPRLVLSVVSRMVLFGVLLYGTYTSNRLTGGAKLAASGGVAAMIALAIGFFRATVAQRLWLSLGAVAGLLTVATAADHFHSYLLADMTWLGLGVMALVRLPLGPGVLTSGVAFASYAVASPDQWFSITMTVSGLTLLGYLLRLDAEARGTAYRLLVQERAAHAAEAESAALAERARIAREIHDVLAHSLSAQLVHLEAARLMLDGDADRAQIRERVVAARRMAQEGLAETRQALSALRGELSPVADHLVELTRRENAALAIEGTPRPLAAEAGVAVRRTAQEALTNVRKHASGGRVTIRLAYLEGSVELEVRNTLPQPSAGGAPMPRTEALDGLTGSGSGYGLLGMRERAELLGGELLAGPDDGGWRVRLRVPA